MIVDESSQATNSNNNNDERDAVEALADQAMALLRDDLPAAQQIAISAHELAQSIDSTDMRLMAPALVAMAACDTAAGNRLQAVERLLRITATAPDHMRADRWLLETHVTLGTIYSELSLYTEALEYHHIQYELAMSWDEPLYAASALRRIGVIHSYMGEFQKAIDYYKQSMAVLDGTDDHIGRGACLNNLSIDYHKLNQGKEALSYAMQAIELFSTHLSYPGLTTAHINAARAYLLMDDGASAVTYLGPALEIMNAGKSGKLHASVLMARAELEHYNEALDDALHTLLEAEQIIRTHNLFVQNTELYQQLSTVHEAAGDYQQALHYYRLMHQEHMRQHQEQVTSRFEYLSVVFRTQQAWREAAVERQRAAAIEARSAREKEYYEQINRMRDEFVYAATHDLKNPLTTIQLYTAILRRQIAPELQQTVNRIDSQATRMNELVMEMLDLARLETGQAINKHPQSISDMLAAVVLDYSPRAKHNQITLEFNAGDGMAAVMVAYDRYYLWRAVSNLISNAIKYSSAGDKVTVSLQQTVSDIQIIVEDTGMGIPEDEIPHIFNRFYRVASEQTTSIEGTGLGLPITRTIVEQHGGKITVSSVEGTGSRFIIILPTATPRTR